MIRSFAALVLLCCMAIAAGGEAARKPLLLVVHSDACRPCVAFDATWSSNREFRDAIRDVYDVREYDWSVPAQRNSAIALGVRKLPTYVAIRDGQCIASHVGFVATEQGIADLMNDLCIPWPSRTFAEPQPPVTAPDPRPPAAVDQTARDSIVQLAGHVDAIEKGTQATQEAVSQIRQDIRAVRSDVATHSQTVTQKLDESHVRTRSDLSRVTTVLRDTLRDAVTAVPAAPISAEIPGTESPGSGLTGWLLKAGLTGAAAYFGWPLGAAAIAAGGIGWWMRRRNAARRGPTPTGIPVTERTRVAVVSTESPPISPVVTTTNHYVPVETDTYQEAHRWASEQLVRRYPGAAASVETLDSLIRQFLDARKAT